MRVVHCGVGALCRPTQRPYYQVFEKIWILHSHQIGNVFNRY